MRTKPSSRNSRGSEAGRRRLMTTTTIKVGVDLFTKSMIFQTNALMQMG
jgi:hypothetical protein